jgi:hypothetical protein
MAHSRIPAGCLERSALSLGQPAYSSPNRARNSQSRASNARRLAARVGGALPAVLARLRGSGFVQRGAAAAATERAHAGQTGAKENHGDGLGDHRGATGEGCLEGDVKLPQIPIP